MTLMTQSSVLTQKQTRTFGPKPASGYGSRALIKAHVRYDDECGNGHNSFAITGEIYNQHRIEACGCLHDEIAAAFPELAPFIKWHLCSSDGPLHYVANTMYHADEHGPTHAWVYYTGPADPLGIEPPTKERLLAYIKADEALRAEGQPGYRVEWDPKTAKARNLDYARSSAIWPDATDEDLIAPGLRERLEARLPALMVEFRAAIEALGFVY